MRALPFITAINETALLEARADRYFQMLAPLLTYVEKDFDTQNKFTNVLRGAVKLYVDGFKREDRIIWALRYFRYAWTYHFHEEINNVRRKTFVYVLGTLANSGYYPEVHPTDEVVSRIDRDLRKLQTKIGDHTTTISTVTAISRAFYRNIEHYLSMNIPQIEEIQWSTQNPDWLLNTFRQIEEEWKLQHQSKGIDMTGDESARPVLQFPDGSAWFDLGRAFCGQEKDAMGHCGNEPEKDNPNLTILSYRIPSGSTWRPALTFILNTKTGMLGEMKGRTNSKPVARYHPYIVELLRQPFIKGIVGGGHDPQSNFSVDDLDQETREALYKEKPELEDLWSQYKREGLTPKVRERLLTMFPDGQIADIEVYEPGDEDFFDADGVVFQTNPDDNVVEKNSTIVYWRSPSVEDFVTDVQSAKYNQAGTEVVRDMFRVINGELDPRNYLGTYYPNELEVTTSEMEKYLNTASELGSPKYDALIEYLTEKNYLPEVSRMSPSSANHFLAFIAAEDNDGDYPGEMLEILDRIKEIIRQIVLRSVPKTLAQNVKSWISYPIDNTFYDDMNLRPTILKNNGNYEITGNLHRFMKNLPEIMESNSYSHVLKLFQFKVLKTRPRKREALQMQRIFAELDDGNDDLLAKLEIPS